MKQIHFSMASTQPVSFTGSTTILHFTVLRKVNLIEIQGRNLQNICTLENFCALSSPLIGGVAQIFQTLLTCWLMVRRSLEFLRSHLPPLPYGVIDSRILKFYTIVISNILQSFIKIDPPPLTYLQNFQFLVPSPRKGWGSKMVR